jgi:hypothetical protein
MKKIAKIKIVEEGRLFSPEESNRIRGGCSTYSTCSTGSSYKECSNGVWITCSQTPSVTGYHNYGPGGSIFCTGGYTYESCHMMNQKFSCGGNLYYENFPL